MSTQSDRTVLILRFRDLVNPKPGTTIAEHSAIIRQHGYVWWAWWKKQTETPPYTLWIQVNQERASGPGPLFLIDSGQRKAYKAQLHTVEFDHKSGQMMGAPEGGQKTPAYYSQSSFATWFKIAGIEEATEADIQGLAYARVPHDDLVTVEKEHFLDHRIAGIAQLLEFGNVTYWVARPAALGSATAIGPRRKPSIRPLAPKDIIRAENSRILHLSDLHVSTKHHAFDLDRADAHNKSLATALHETLGGDPPGVVIVTGDLTWTGHQAEFDLTFKCLDDIRSALGLVPDKFVIIPGNHDLQWTSEQRKKDEYKATSRVEVATNEAQENYRQFFLRWYASPANEHLSIARRFFLLGGPTLDVLGVNSSALQQIEKWFAGMGRVTEEALRKSAVEMGWDQEPRATSVRILATHHHVLPVLRLHDPADAKRGFGIAIDAEAQLIAATELGVDIILHGHQHHPYVGLTHRQKLVEEPLETTRPILVVGAGSAGVEKDYLPTGFRSFNVLELRHNGVVLESYSTFSEPKTFRRHARLYAPWGGSWQPAVAPVGAS